MVDEKRKVEHHFSLQKDCDKGMKKEEKKRGRRIYLFWGIQNGEVVQMGTIGKRIRMQSHDSTVAAG